MNTLDLEQIKNNKLWKLMYDNGFTDCKTFAYKLIDSGYYTAFKTEEWNKSANYESDEYKQYFKNADTLSKSIKRCLYTNKYKNDDLLVACCKFFECSADYLLGLIDLPTHEKTDFNKLTGLFDNCIDTLKECNKHEAYDNSFAGYNRNITMVLNYLLYQGKDRKKDNLINHNKLTLLNSIFNYLVFSDFYTYTDKKGNLQGSHITFTDINGTGLCSLPVANMHNAIKLNINSILDTLRVHMKVSGFYTIQKPTLESLFEDIEKEQNKINDWDSEMKEILENNSPINKKDYIGTLSRCIGISNEKIHQIKNMIVSYYKDMLQKKDFSTFPEWQQSILEKLYMENECYITDKI